MPGIHPDDSETLRYGDGPVGVVVSHGFTGTTASIRPWAESLAQRGDTSVIAPRLTGHGTRWEDMNHVNWQEWELDISTAYAELARHCEVVFVGGLSMGGALALRLAQTRPVAGVLLVNPAIASRDRTLRMTGLLHRVVSSRPGIASDIAKPDVTEPGYDRLSVRAAWQLTKLWAAVRSDLSRVRVPVLLLKSQIDHLVDDLSQQILREAIPQLEEIPLPRSFHVATLDHDMDVIATQSSEFIDHVLETRRRGGFATP